MIIGGIAFLSSIGNLGGIAHSAHLGGLVVGYLYLKSGRGGLTAELKYRYLKWKMNRLRKRFDVYSGGRNDWNRHIH
jgi:membrane associated rhomboid family serine protease